LNSFSSWGFLHLSSREKHTFPHYGGFITLTKEVKMARGLKQNALTRNGGMFSMFLSKEHVEYLEKESEKTGLSKGYIVRQIIKKYIEEISKSNQ